MKTTLEIPDRLFRLAKARAALRGIPLREYVTEALEEKLAASKAPDRAANPPWMRDYGGLADLSEETRRVEEAIAEEFGKVTPEDWS